MANIEHFHNLENVSDDPAQDLPALARLGHVAHCMRCITGLPESQIEIDSSRWVFLM